jgi:hypothetical protein
MSAERVSVTRVIAATPEALFAVLADPARHLEIDGSGTLRGFGEASGTRLALGSKFGMSMRHGLPYKMVNEVVEFEDDRLIAWKPRLDGPAFIGSLTGSVIWRYAFEPVEGGTRVTETWDPSESKMSWMLGLLGEQKSAQANMEKTLERLEDLVTNA